MSPDTLAFVWFCLLGVLLIGYVILDGFDLGVGILHLVARRDDERRVMMNSIGPLWDGNEVWLVTFGGALFAAFPIAYATVFSAFYVPFMLLLFGLIFRAVSLEFRSKVHSRAWRGLWDVAFSLSSALVAFLFGVAGGNLIRGIPVDAEHVFQGTLTGMLHPYPVLVGLMTVALFAMHGAIFPHLKTEGELQRRIHTWMWRTFGFFLITYVFTTMFTLVEVPSAVDNLRAFPVLWVVPVLNVLAVANIPRAIHRGRAGDAFISSCCVIAALAFLFAVAIFPNFVTSSLDPAWSITVWNAASSPKTLTIMLIVAGVGMPFVLTYTAIVYWVFRGKVTLDEKTSY